MNFFNLVPLSLTHECLHQRESSCGTHETDLMHGVLQDVALLSTNGPASSLGSPYAQSVHARSGQETGSAGSQLEHLDPHLQLIHNNRCSSPGFRRLCRRNAPPCSGLAWWRFVPMHNVVLFQTYFAPAGTEPGL